MINQLGNYSLIFGLLISIFIIFYCIYLLKDKKNKSLEKLFSFLSVQLFLAIFSFITLIYAFIISDFSNKTVYEHSHTTKPLFYKISGTWGNHEGSLLLWLMILILFIFLYFLNSKKLSNDHRLLTVFFQQLIISGFFLFIVITSNPFEFLYPIPIEGLGLNPILQDPALAIHPPILYIGYVGTSIIFSSSLAALVEKNINSKWANHIKKWIYISWVLLTLGIMLGSIWAYYELGWGGFWFWDPVENVSLMPWFCLTALIHTINVLEKRLIFKSWTLILSIATFSLSMSGTFLVRSGILNSVHTFANDPTRGLFILIFLFLLIILALTIFFIFSEKDNHSQKNTYWLSKEIAILVNNWFMMFFLSVVLIGTTYPIFLEVVNDHKISVGPPFYQKLIGPFLIPFLIFMAFGPNLNWIKNKITKINLNFIILFLISLIISYSIVNYSSVKYLFLTFLLASSFFLLVVTLKDLLNKKLKISQKISHLAFSVFILSILFNGMFSKEFSSNMKVGDEVKFLDQMIKFKSLSSYNKINYKTLRGEFEVVDNDGSLSTFYPEIRIYNQPEILTSEADIQINIFKDNFLVFNLLKDDYYFNVRYQYKTMMIWIWISIIFLAIGGFLGVLKK